MPSQKRITAVGEALLDKMFESFPDFDWRAEDAQEKWEALRWTDAQEKEWMDWAERYVREQLRWNKTRTHKEVMKVFLRYSPRLEEDK